MATSRIEITFTEDLDIGDKVYFEKRYQDNIIQSEWQPVDETWVSQRNSQNTVTKGTPTSTPGERTAINFVQAISLDYQFTYLQNGVIRNGVGRSGNKVTIMVDRFWNFRLIDPDPTDESVSIEIFNFPNPYFYISDIEYEQATTNPVCSHYKVVLTTSELATSYTLNGVETLGNTDNPITFELLRGQSFNIVLNSADDQNASIIKSSTQAPQYLNAGNFDILVTESISGAVITATPLLNYNEVLNIEYSLDDETWHEEGMFSGLSEGEYTLYVRDDIGCSFEYDFSISALNIERLPYFKLPKSNSIRFAERVEWGNCSNQKNNDNTLSYESEVLKPFKHTILMQSCDTGVVTQFRSNNAENIVTVIRENGDEQNITVNQMTNNMGVTDKRDARKYNLGNGKTGIYFISGNIYDHVTESVTGTYALNGLLPYWGVVGNIMSIGGIFFQIQDVIFDESVNADVLVIDNVYTGANTTAIVASEYNIENFEEWEFILNFNNYLNETIQIRINSNDDDFTNLVQLSEDINTKTVHEDTLEIKYKNSTNTDLNFSRGLECILRLPFTRIDGEILDESENTKTDTTTILLNATIYN